ncbi:hypothetical protein HUK65_17670 [Rhodobacteraceae bacterium 2376]|uniref:Uncharacterized protein n=1 Tax=Rhabdonatronobacter sediminivivens TaxID=2743469 RepID=A0A7Z0L375_9RHOB|nr:hypothetical protein [Rhabdonatronobacter sediminivivens]NYS26798.1 hypothetical protein [Rhabdonatronobacter sediminivivens]
MPIPIPTIADLPFAKTPTPALQLPHRLVPVSFTQARLRGRQMLVPDLDLGAYRFRALIDWIEFRMRFSRGVQVQQLQPVMLQVFGRNAHIVAEDKGPGGVFTRCRIKVQEPPNLAMVAKAHQALVSTFGETERSWVTGIEISIDAYPKTPCPIARARLLGAMQRTIWTDRDIWTDTNSRPRSVFGGAKQTFKLSPGPEMDADGDARTEPGRHVMPVVDGTMLLGARYDDLMIRVMEKVIDRQRLDGTHQRLTESEKRVRIEVTLRGNALLDYGLVHMDALNRVRFMTLQKDCFRFKLPTFDPRMPISKGVDLAHNRGQARQAETYLRAGITGLMVRDAVMQRRRAQVRRQAIRALKAMGRPVPNALSARRAPALVSYEELNRRVVIALQHLDKREQTAWRRMEGKL